jgi:hypothetical protein
MYGLGRITLFENPVQTDRILDHIRFLSRKRKAQKTLENDLAVRRLLGHEAG